MKFSYMSLFIVCTLVFIALQPLVRAASDQTTNPEYWYNKGVDLANEGKYDEALAATDHALALNATFPRAHAMRSGLLVMAGRYDEAITEADLALATKENLTVTISSAWSNKGDALRHLGRIEEARAAFAKAQELDPSLVPPDMSVPLTPAVPTLAKSPLPGFLVLAGLAGGFALSYHVRYKIL